MNARKRVDLEKNKNMQCWVLIFDFFILKKYKEITD